MTAIALSGLSAQSTAPTTQTMSSREIAELLCKQHSHIKISAERLAEKGVIRRRVVEMRKDRVDRFIKSTPRELRAQTREALDE